MSRIDDTRLMAYLLHPDSAQEVDYGGQSVQEKLTLAHLCQDPELMRVYRNPHGDVHTETSNWLGLNDRNVAKEINFAICFGMGATALYRKINELKEARSDTDFISLDTAQSYIDGFYGRFPGVREFVTTQVLPIKKIF